MQQFTGYEYIKIDVANQFGLDKLTWDKRIEWVNENHDKLEKLDHKADDRLLYIKAVRALRDAELHKPTGFIMGLDATASGLQIMAALMGCKNTAQNVNLMNTGNREDIYQKVANEMDKICDEEITKELVKKPVMTTFYGSMKQPESAFGEDTPALDAFYEILFRELPGAMECMEDIQSCWNDDTSKHLWTLPDGHVASVKVMAPIDKKVEVNELVNDEGSHATFTHRVYVNKPQEDGLSLAANVIHSIDGYIVREMYRMAEEQGFELLTIHDSFWASPNYMNEVRENYLKILITIADSNLLQDILNEITMTNGIVTKVSNDLSKDIAQAEYALS